jgi:hypothetical protein
MVEDDNHNPQGYRYYHMVLGHSAGLYLFTTKKVRRATTAGHDAADDDVEGDVELDGMDEDSNLSLRERHQLTSAEKNEGGLPHIAMLWSKRPLESSRRRPWPCALRFVDSAPG